MVWSAYVAVTVVGVPLSGGGGFVGTPPSFFASMLASPPSAMSVVVPPHAKSVSATPASHLIRRVLRELRRTQHRHLHGLALDVDLALVARMRRLDRRRDHLA